MKRAEAIKQVREWDFLSKDDKEVLAVLVPELRESEDERIRKEIYNFLIDMDCKREWIAYLEKQKENPKSADSISADCASNAKCEDRWKKVGERLPNSPREVLCKDEAGNYFIGRYYLDEGWEISNYDAEDKPHRLNPPVSMWIDIPSEKQKEPKHALRLVGDGLYSDQNAHFELESEQKPAEWSEEDEKMLRTIISDGIRGVELDSKQITWLKDLRSRPVKADNWKPSEEHNWSPNADEIQSIRNAITMLVERGLLPYSVKHLKRLLAHYEGVKPRVDWAPTEEQMAVLLNAKGLVRANNYPDNAKILASLYEQLKKLM